jgi:hypothetical protein
MTYRGCITDVVIPEWGLAMLTIRRADGTIDEIPAEPPIAIAALLRWFNCDIEHGPVTPAVRSCEVVYSVDDLGILIAFTPYDRWLFTSRPEIPADGIDDDAIYRAVQKIIRAGKVS